MERIAPLAKILAEANGIDWRNLQGTGDGGTIVEQDILNYLTRVMSGEEDPPPTPVDAPPPEWTGTELPPGGGLLGPGMPSMDMLSSAGVDSDLAALVGQPQTSAPAPEPATYTAEELEFELEDEPADVVPLAPQPEPVPAAAEVPAQPAFTPAARHEPPAAPEAPAGSGRMAGLGSLLSRLYQPKATEAEASAPPAAPTFEPPAAEMPATESPEPVMPAAPLPEETPAPAAEAAPAAPQPAEEPQVPAATEVEEEAEVVLAEPLPAEEAAPMPIPAAPAASEPARNAVWFGAYLRRDANLTPVTDLRRQLVSALGQDVPLALLVARAAQQHVDTLNLQQVAVHDLGSGQDHAAQPGTLRSALAEYGSPVDGTPDLLVIDAGALDLDDLHLPHTVTLSVGRVQDGRAALTLQGDVDPAQAARFLANVAGTLEEPIILVV